jgi:hypothetical protein
MLTAELPVPINIPKPVKRRWIPWYRLPTVPICPHCNAVCLVGKTITGNDGKVVQHRYCEHCTFSIKVALSTSEIK